MKIAYIYPKIQLTNLQTVGNFSWLEASYLLSTY